MATRLYGTSRGKTEFQITDTVGSPTVSNDIELTVDLAKNLDKNDVLVKLQELTNYILEHNWPPA